MDMDINVGAWLGSVLPKIEALFARERQVAQRKSSQWYAEYPECSPSGSVQRGEWRPVCATKRLYSIIDMSDPS